MATCAPPCASCSLPLATPIVLAEVERWDGPSDANLFCPSCGNGWVGDAVALKAAEASWLDYERETAEQEAPARTVLDALADSAPPEPQPVPVLPGQLGIFE